jgi:hypothetical protein
MDTFSGTTVTDSIPILYRITLLATTAYDALTLHVDGSKTGIAAAVVEEERDRLGWLMEQATGMPLHTARWFETATGSIGYLRVPHAPETYAPRIEDALRRWRGSQRGE